MGKILVIDDSVFQREAIKVISEHFGVEFFEADNGEKGVELIESIKPDLVICDLLMPVMDGFEVLKFAKEKKIESKIYIMSADKQEEHIATCYRLGADRVISKPATKEALIDAIGEFFGSQDE